VAGGTSIVLEGEFGNVFEPVEVFFTFFLMLVEHGI
jgi:hypothetical protein